SSLPDHEKLTCVHERPLEPKAHLKRAARRHSTITDGGSGASATPNDSDASDGERQDGCLLGGERNTKTTSASAASIMKVN
ncbi:hypothetical protein M9458_002477, partial [Cirrhinus mrigala]